MHTQNTFTMINVCCWRFRFFFHLAKMQMWFVNKLILFVQNAQHFWWSTSNKSIWQNYCAPTVLDINHLWSYFELLCVSRFHLINIPYQVSISNEPPPPPSQLLNTSTNRHKSMDRPLKSHFTSKWSIVQVWNIFYYCEYSRPLLLSILHYFILTFSLESHNPNHKSFKWLLKISNRYLTHKIAYYKNAFQLDHLLTLHWHSGWIAMNSWLSGFLDFLCRTWDMCT